MNVWKVSIIGMLSTILFILVFWPFVSVPAGRVGVVTLFGKVQQESLTEGLHFINPLAKVNKLSIQILKTEVKGDAASRDLQHVTTSIALNYHLNGSLAPKFFQSIGAGADTTIIAPAVEEILKAATAKYTAEELISKRDEVRIIIKTDISDRLRERTFGSLVVDDVSITNFQFSTTFNKAIEAKQEAEQMALKAQRDLTRIQVEAQQSVARARAEADSLKLQKEQITPELLKLREIEVQREAINKWDGKLPYFNGGSVTPLVNIK